MTRTIWKTPLEITDEQVIEIPEDYQILDIQVQKDQVCMWYICDDRNPKRKVTIICHGTGHPLNHWENKLHHIGTVQVYNGTLVFHYFIREVIIKQ